MLDPIVSVSFALLLAFSSLAPYSRILPYRLCLAYFSSHPQRSTWSLLLDTRCHSIYSTMAHACLTHACQVAQGVLRSSPFFQNPSFAILRSVSEHSHSHHRHKHPHGRRALSPCWPCPCPFHPSLINTSKSVSFVHTANGHAKAQFPDSVSSRVLSLRVWSFRRNCVTFET